ncbi:MAG: LTA synthase family protein, partial [Gammaproteobacteria bacterium]|nr:LTA synthase family protein [Gammaproteobacteria bacterium]
MRSFFERRFGPIYLLTLLFVGIAALTRLALLLHSPSDGLTAIDLVGAFAIGLGYDIVTAAYFAIPLILYLTLLPEKAYRGRVHHGLLSVGFLVLLYLLLFVAVAEWVFWDEFESRFNFIAVDYLVYTNEVLGNIWESYPVPGLLGVIGVATLAVFLPLRRRLRAAGPATRLRQRLGEAALLLAVPVLATLGVDASQATFSTNRYANELAGNGIYSFFAAYRNNEIDYARYYALRNDEQVFQHLRALLAEPDTRFVGNDPHDITRAITGRGPEQRLNVVLISVESLSAEFLGSFGSDRQATPYLDALAHDSLLFTRVYATGTRTDRGLEAITLSVPPTAGRSLVKRPHNENLFSLGQVFREHGYRTEFLYGGYGYFDNMNYFFAHNGFKAVDRNSIPKQDIHFENVWGVADEDLYTLTLKELDAAHAAAQPFFGLVMTTSNHRPYTYPDGRIDIPSPGGRTGAVKYTDSAIHDFIERARSKPWFDDTVFVVIADHCAKSAGKEALTVAQYHIPLLIYAPKHIAPGKVERLVSQIDLAPTLLGLLNFSYKSQ